MSFHQKRPEQLSVAAGYSTERGPRTDNEDYCAFFEGTPAQRMRHGVIAVIADGVGGAKGGRVAAETVVRGFIDGYLGQSELLGVQKKCARAIEAMNRWIHAIGRTNSDLQGMACTLTALILRGRQAHIVHVGDSRLYRLRHHRLDLLTRDHTFNEWGMQGVLRRAVGASDSLQIDYLAEPVQVHDRYLLCTDGVHGSLSERVLRDELARRASPDETARAVTAAALAARGSDNATALVLDVLNLPPASQPDLELAIAAQPILPPPTTGTVVDGFDLEAQLSDGRYSRVFRAYDTVAKRPVILKFPKPIHGADVVLRQAFVRETWIAARVRSPWVAEVLDIPPERQTRLYSVMPFYAGEILEARLQRSPQISLAEGLTLATRLTKAVAALHRAGIVHRDIKPDNVILEQEENRAQPGLRLIDLGVARVDGMDDFALEHAPGTPSYMAPELFTGAPGDELSDQFAVAVTIYRLFSRAYPYGEIEPFSRPRFSKPTPLTSHRPDLPAWLDQVLARALAVSPRERFGDILELAFELEHGSARALPTVLHRKPLYERNPVLVWQIVSVTLAVLLFMSWAFR
ncbi:protein phosphatase [Microvirga sp. KLBC 81]|uniref:bifunctional protein-serine/threonine kinase/phosphatase n=1 Tax=Microvirga sp. KLBC 81 TaxID=1862707 RepID=UPI000D515AAE|nr:bifunctional protein-serine/threonine kinase/phosphatase [Microvirga sp. KLBC 81]PVE20714.1 protein phosphatase [Microvirga sp. KLBC 81]